MALNGLNFGDFSENMWKMVPPDHPPPSPNIWKIPYVFCIYNLEASLRVSKLKV